MDPNAALQSFLYALKTRDYGRANEAHSNLREWLAGGGFEPTWTPAQRRRFETYRHRVRFPSIADVAHDLHILNKEESFPGEEGECYIDVRLQVTDEGWYIHSGDSSFDTDHRGDWGSSTIPGNGRRFNSEEVARSLIEQARDSHAQRE